MARDWPADLWPTSFKGVPFWTRKVDGSFDKRLQIDVFPEQDDPFVQELGADYRTEQVEAYLVGDDSDSAADAFVSTMRGLGTGTLVLPDQGPVEVMFHKGRRTSERDRQGFIAFALTFVRVADGGLDDGGSTDYLANMVSDAADALDDAASDLTSQFGLS